MFHCGQLALLSHSLSPTAENPCDKHKTGPILLTAWGSENE